jgi:hypothetical protein
MEGSMKVELVKVSELLKDPANARKHGVKNVAAIEFSLKKFGQQKPIVVDANGVVLAGNGTLEAAQNLEWETIQIVRTSLTGSEAIAYAIADNRTSELAEWEGSVLAAQLQSLLSEDAELLAASGFNDDELDSLLIKSMAEAEIDGGETEPEPEPEPDTTTSFTILLTADQEITYRKAVAMARKQPDVATAGDAVAFILGEWLSGQVE